MKILALSNCRLDRLLGSGRTRHAWADGLTGLGHAVTLVDSEALLGSAEHRPAGRRARLTVAAWRWLSALDLAAYDLIEFYGSEFWLATRQLARRRRRPVLVAHTDGLELLMSERLAASGDPASRRPAWKELPARWMARAERLAFSRADGFVAGCKLDCEFLARRGVGRASRREVVPIGIDPAYLDLPFEAEGREERVVFVGSWIPRKGVRHLSAVMTSLLHARPGLTLDLFGRDDDDAPPLRHFPADVHGQIVVHPRVDLPTLIAALQRARVYFFPSEYEGFGLGLAEAMACGLAAVTTPTGFGAELRDGEEALLCPFGDVRAMEAAIARLLDDPALGSRIARAGWRRAQTLRWDTSVRRLEEIYRRWIEEESYAAAAA